MKIITLLIVLMIPWYCLAFDSSGTQEQVVAEIQSMAASEIGSPNSYGSEEFADNELLLSDSVWFPVIRYATCNGGWPGSRTCSEIFKADRDIRINSVSIRIITEGEPGVSVQEMEAHRVDSRTVQYFAQVNEGDVLNQGKHTSSFAIEWEGYRGYPGDWIYCSADAPCEKGLGDCDSNAECTNGLACVNDIGEYFGYDPGVDVCLSIGG